jgi:hypothetical protein
MTDSDIKEIAKATAEVSKFGTKALETTEKMLGFFARVFKEPIESVSGIIGDKLKFIRWQRQIRIVDKVNEILENRKLTQTNAVSPKFALPMLQNASFEENDELQDIWIRLIANSMDPNFNIELRFAFIEIIKSLNPLDAKILDLFYKILEQDLNMDWKQITTYSLNKEQICELLQINLDDYFVSIYNLFRVQCLAPAILKSIGTKL